MAYPLTKSAVRMRTACATGLLLAAGLALFGGESRCAAIGRYSMWLTAHPQYIVANSQSSVTISAEVRDSTGAAVPDGTIVEFASSLGIIEQRARTAAGVARVRLTSGSAVGTAVVSAVVPDRAAVAEVRVEFLEPGTELFEESFILLSSDKYLGYDTEKQVVDAAGGLRFEHRGLVIEAEEAQLDVRRYILRAKAKPGQRIVISRGSKELFASALVYDLNPMKGILLGPVEDGAERLAFRGTDLRTSPDDTSSDSLSFDFQPISESKLFIRAKTILIRPGEDIRFKKATYFIDGERALSIPLQVLSLKSGTPGVTQMLTYGTEGIRLDLPIYYSLTPNAAGSVRVKRSESTGWGNYSNRAGWQIDLDNEYNYGGRTQGKFTVNRVTSSDWGIRWYHRLLYDNDSQLYSYFDFPGHRDLFGSVDYSRSMRNITFSLSLRGNKYRGAELGYYGATYLQTRPKPIFRNAVSYAVSTRLAYDSRQIAGRKVGTGFGMQLYGKPVQLGRGASLNMSLSLNREWGGSDPGLSIYANTGFFGMLGTKGFFGLNYSYAWSDSAYGYDSQRLSASVNLRPSIMWSTSLYTTYGLNDGTLSAFGDLSYSFAQTWRLGVLGTYQKFAFSKYTDAEFLVSKSIGRQEVMLTYSQSRKRFRIEINPLGF